MIRYSPAVQGLQQGFATQARDFHNSYDQAHLADAIDTGPQAYADESFNQARGRWNYGSPMDQFMQASQEAVGGKPFEFGYNSNPSPDLSRSAEAIDALQRTMPFQLKNPYGTSPSMQLGTQIDPATIRKRKLIPGQDDET